MLDLPASLFPDVLLMSESPVIPPEIATAEDEKWMAQALVLAEQGRARGEVPVGSILVREGIALAEGFNQPISMNDPTAHAEIVALRAAASVVGNYRLPNTTLYVTLEPCTMCIGALMHARVSRLVFAAREPRAGAVCSQLQLCDHAAYNHRIVWQEGVLAEQSAELLTGFFKARR
jgi:tRNA(adenine34) deaminase